MGDYRKGIWLRSCIFKKINKKSASIMSISFEALFKTISAERDQFKRVTSKTLVPSFNWLTVEICSSGTSWPDCSVLALKLAFFVPIY